MELFALEHKRLWRTTRVWLCVLLCFFYCVIYTGVISYQWTYFGSEGDDPTNLYSNEPNGYSMIRTYNARADQYGEYWTDETLQRLIKDFQTMIPHTSLSSMYDWTVGLSALKLYEDLEDPENQQHQPLIHYVDTDELTDFYERRQDYLEYNLKVNKQNLLLTDEDVEMLREMDSQVKTPWRYEWTKGWEKTLTGTLPLLSRMAPYLAIVLGFLFSGEWHDSTAPLLHTTRYGWRKLAWVKVLSGFAFAVEFYGIIAGGMVLLQLIYLGTDGWDVPIQMLKILAVAPWNMLQAELYELAFAFLGVIGYAGLVMLMSALVKSNVLSLVFSLSFIYVPSLLDRYLPMWVQDAMQFIPMVGTPTDIFRMNIFHIFGKGVWLPWMTITIPVVIGLVCAPFAIVGWARRQRV